MRAVDIIAKKRDGGVLSSAEIGWFVDGLTSGDIPDYQVAAWAMAVLLRGMSDRETIDLTMAMVNSGEVIDLSSLGGRVVDKHSTGGVGDKTTLVVAPVVAAAGLYVAKMSGRGLGFSGGTLDKLESIAGYNVNLGLDAFMRVVSQAGVVVAGQTADLAPADGKLYALRDVTATVPSLPLIASSIMSKKIAGGAEAIVLDVKTGRGAFMPTIEAARELAEMMIRIGEGVGRRVTAVLSDMNQPLGSAVGNAIEVKEAMATLQGGGPILFREHCAEVAAEMLLLGGVADDPEAARMRVSELLSSGQAWERFVAWIGAQGGDTGQVENPDRLPSAPVRRQVLANDEGNVAQVDAREVALTAVALGAGREKKGEPIDHSVGIEVLCRVGDTIEAGQPLFVVHAQSEQAAQAATQRLLRSVRLADEPVAPLPAVYEVIRG